MYFPRIKTLFFWILHSITIIHLFYSKSIQVMYYLFFGYLAVLITINFWVKLACWWKHLQLTVWIFNKGKQSLSLSLCLSLYIYINLRITQKRSSSHTIQISLIAKFQIKFWIHPPSPRSISVSLKQRNFKIRLDSERNYKFEKMRLVKMESRLLRLLLDDEW